jgi:hypothetical protein
MKTKEEMVKYLTEKNIEVPEQWNDIQKVYFENVKAPEIEKVRVLTKSEKLQLKRDKLYPRIKELVGEMKGQTKATQPQIKELFSLFNAYYLRRDNPSCSVCLSRVYVTFTKLIKIKR